MQTRTHMKKNVVPLAIGIAVICSTFIMPGVTWAAEQKQVVPKGASNAAAYDACLKGIEMFRPILSISVLEPGKIQVSGVVATELIRTKAEEILKGVKGIESIDNQVRVPTGLQWSPD